MAGWSRWLRSAAGSTACALALAGAAQAGPLDFAKVHSSADARRLFEWVQRNGDNAGRPFAVVDKRGARLYVFDAEGHLAGQTPVLIGSTPGDHTVPGVGARAQTGEVGPDERTTPAGRFDATPGQNLSGERIVWVDYAAAFAIHRVRPGKAWKARAARLATPTASDNRVSYGCVVVPEAFYRQVVESVLGGSRSVVYVLPETRPLQAMLGELAQQ